MNALFVLLISGSFSVCPRGENYLSSCFLFGAQLDHPSSKRHTTAHNRKPHNLSKLTITLMGLVSSNCSSPLESRFALRALVRIPNLSPSSAAPSPLSSNRGFSLRKCQRVKLAAYTSMASATGDRRVWSRVALQRIRCPRRSKDSCCARRRRRAGNKVGREAMESRYVKKLRKLVPGGESMDVEGLLQEAAHYIECLVTQVQVMRSIADICCYACLG